MYKIQFLDEASRSLKRIDGAIARRIIRKLNWLAENAENVEPKGLRNDLSGNAKLREGDHRIIYRIFHDEELILIRFIGHRSEVYKTK